MQGCLMQRLCCTRMSQATVAPSSPEPTPIFCNCCWQLHPFLLPEHGLIWILAVGNLNQVCRNDPETHSVLPLFASWPGYATYIFSDAWKLFLHHSGSAGVTCGTAPSLPDIAGRRQEPSTQVSCLACESWQVLHSLWQQRELEANLQLYNWVSKHGWACSGNNALQLPRDEWLCQTPWLWQAPPPAASVPGLMPCLNLEDHSRPVALTALHTWQEMCLLLLHCAGVEVRGAVLAPNVASEAGSRPVYNSSSRC